MTTTPAALRANTSTTSNFFQCVLDYAQMAATTEVRLCITQRYVDESELPVKDYTLIQNTPLLLAIATVNLPYLKEALHVVIDYPGLTMQRDHRATEVRDLVDQLLQTAPKKLRYSLQPVVPTSHIQPDAAAVQLLASDYTDLTPASRDDFLRRLK